MKKRLLVLLTLILPYNGYAQQPIYGDVNGDNEVNIADINSVINIILDDKDFTTSADVNKDGEINIADINAVINIILTGQPIVDDQDWVDLGLTSGTLWATRNIGANTPEGYGDYFAWGETAPKSDYKWSTYKWCIDGEYDQITKYCIDSDCGYNGFTDGKTELDPEDDAAYVNWGSSWRMPTVEQQQELKRYCTWRWTTRNGVNGKLGTGPNGNSIFLPAAGCIRNKMTIYAGSSGRYWSRTRGPNYSYYACYMHFFDDYMDWDDNDRCFGHTVRAVRVQ